MQNLMTEETFVSKVQDTHTTQTRVSSESTEKKLELWYTFLGVNSVFDEIILNRSNGVIVRSILQCHCLRPTIR